MWLNQELSLDKAFGVGNSPPICRICAGYVLARQSSWPGLLLPPCRYSMCDPPKLSNSERRRVFSGNKRVGSVLPVLTSSSWWLVFTGVTLDYRREPQGGCSACEWGRPIPSQFYIRINPSTSEISPCIRVLQRSRIIGSMCIYIYAVLSHFSHVWLCVTLIDCGPGPSVHGLLQEKILEWIVRLSSRRSSWPRDQTHVSYVSYMADRFFTTSATSKAPLPISVSIYLCIVQLLSHVWLCDPVDCSPPCSSTHGILQVRILEWVITSYSKIFISIYLYVYVYTYIYMVKCI